MGLSGVWWGMVVGNLLGSFLAFSWANIYIRRLMSEDEISRSDAD
jgi:Na+-driven multidrug efflux pump